jgi:hypothetical protein
VDSYEYILNGQHDEEDKITVEIFALYNEDLVKKKYQEKSLLNNVVLHLGP